jgi:formate hydrogenlyase transcriptional activator
LQALQTTGWLVGGPGGAATRLGLKRTTLIAKMKKLGISRPLPKDDTNELAANEDSEYQPTG